MPKVTKSLVLLAIGSLILRYITPTKVVGYSPHDDLLQVRIANSIFRGEWLGQYQSLGHLTMVKPPGYPLFLSLSMAINVPPQLTVHLIVVTASMLFFSLQVARLGQMRAALLFLVFLSWPGWYGPDISRYYREGLVAALIIAIFCCTAALSRLVNLAKKTPFRSILTFCLASLIFLLAGFLNITKPVTLALIPVCIFCIFLVAKHLKDVITKAKFRAASIVLAVLCSVALFQTPSSIVKTLNNSNYSISALDTYSSGVYREVISKLSSLPPRSNEMEVIVSNEQLITMSKVGGLTQRVGERLQGNDLESWRSVSCTNGGPCDSTGGWFMFALRDAVALEGLDTSAKSFENAFGQIAAEVDDFCAEHQCTHGDWTIGVKDPRDLSLGSFLASYLVVFSEIFVTASSFTPAVTTDGLPHDWDGIPGINEDVVASNFTPPPHGLLVKVFPLLFAGTVAFAFYDLLRSLRQSGRDFRQRIWQNFDVLTGLLAVLTTFLLSTQLALLQASSGIYLTNGSSLYVLSVGAVLVLWGPLLVFQIASKYEVR